MSPPNVQYLELLAAAAIGQSWPIAAVRGQRSLSDRRRVKRPEGRFQPEAVACLRPRFLRSAWKADKSFMAC